MNKLFFLLTIILFTAVSCATGGGGEGAKQESASSAQVQDVRLSGVEILKVFANVRDDAEVQDAEGTRAINLWYADGTFLSKWQGSNSAGELSGRWFVNKDQRCVLILLSQGQATSQQKCGPVFRRGQQYISRNADGSVHGIHTLSPLKNVSSP